MKRLDELLEQVREAIGGYQRWDGTLLKSLKLSRASWRIYCGEGRLDVRKMNCAVHRKTGVALNFQITGEAEAVTAFEICVAWLEAEWRLMLHLDPKKACWPSHPRYHLQLQAPTLCRGNPPFSAWRVPLGETDPVKLLEYVVGQLDADATSARGGSVS